MKKLSYMLIGIGFAATAAQAQSVSDQTLPAGPETSAAPATPEAAPPPEASSPADTADTAPAPTEAAPAPTEAARTVADAGAFTDAQIDAFAAATVKVQAINSDATIAADQKQAKMQAAVTAAGIDAATYNKISQAVATDTELRSRVQVAMARHAGHAEDQPSAG